MDCICKRNKRLIAIVIAGLLLSFSTIKATETYYVGPNGSDSTGNGSMGDPFATISHAVGLSDIGDGTNESERDYIYVLDGDYTNDQPQVNIGSTKKYITISAVNPGSVTMKSSVLLFKLLGTHNITINGLYVTATTQYSGSFALVGLETDNQGCRDITISNNRYTNGSYGIRVFWSHSVLIENNWFNNNGNSPDGGHTGILVSNTQTTSWADRIIVRNNVCNGNGEDGIQTAGAIDNSHADEDHVAAYVEVYNNEFSNNGENGIDAKATRCSRFYNNTLIGNSTPGIGIHSPENTGEDVGSFKNAFYNNLVKDNGGWGICILDGDYARGYTKNLIFNNLIIGNNNAGIFTYTIAEKISGDKIFNNTVYGTSGDGSGIWDGGYGVAVRCSTIEVVNNIVYANEIPGFSIWDVGIKVNNIHDGDSIPNNIVVDPRLIDPANNDFHLQEDSPAIDNTNSIIVFSANEITDYKNLLGDDLPINIYGPTFDYDGIARPQGQFLDIGAYEYQQGGVEEYLVYAYPNSCRVYRGENIITFSGDLNIGDNIKVYNMSGKIVYNSGNLSETTYQLNTSEVASGVYFFVVKSSDGETKTSGKIAVIR